MAGVGLRVGVAPRPCWWAATACVSAASFPAAFRSSHFPQRCLLQGVAQDSVLCCSHCVTLSYCSLLPVLLRSLRPPPSSLSSLHFVKSGTLIFFSVCCGVSFGLSDTPSPRALAHGFVLSLVHGSQSCLCEAVS